MPEFGFDLKQNGDALSSGVEHGDLLMEAASSGNSFVVQPRPAEEQGPALAAIPWWAWLGGGAFLYGLVYLWKRL